MTCKHINIDWCVKRKLATRRAGYISVPRPVSASSHISRGGSAMHRTYLLCLALLASGAARAHAQNAADSAGIRATAHDYIDGWYEGDAARMERALHTHLAKRLVYQDDQGRSRLVDLTALELVQSTRRGVGKIPPAERRDSGTTLGTSRNAPSARVEPARPGAFPPPVAWTRR